VHVTRQEGKLSGWKRSPTLTRSSSPARRKTCTTCFPTSPGWASGARSARRAGGTTGPARRSARGSPGANELPERTWETRSEVVAADRGQEFAFVVNGSIARWGYTFTPVDGGTQITESWEFLPAGIAFFEERFGDEAPAQIENRVEAARTSIPATLAAIKKIAEAG